jgi:plasmid maintenance system killer protein
MKVRYDTSELEASCTIEKTMKKRYARPIASALKRRIKQLESAVTIGDLLEGLGKWRPLTNKGVLVYAGNLSANWRIVVQFRTSDMDIVGAVVLEIIDYH